VDSTGVYHIHEGKYILLKNKIVLNSVIFSKCVIMVYVKTTFIYVACKRRITEDENNQLIFKKLENICSAT
jgi:hypothetical protein